MIPPEVLKWRVLAQMGASFDLKPAWILGLIWQESRGNPAAWNPEGPYKWFWNVATNRPFRPVTAAEIAAEYPPEDFPTLAGDRDQEWWAQQASWGLMQPMGAVARECGYRGPWLTELVRDPELNVQIGCTHFARKLKQAVGDVYKAALLWNGGGNAKYPVEFLAKVKEIEDAKVFG